MNIEILVTDYTSPFYQDVLELRQEILRKPLGLHFEEDDLLEDKYQYIIIVLNEQKVIACVLLKVLDSITIKIRQMAVANEFQRKGIGALLMKYAENFCILNRYYHIELHARTMAIPFYEKLGFSIVGNEFIEVGIPHKKMIKNKSRQ